jgi:hypothetical protein
MSLARLFKAAITNREAARLRRVNDSDFSRLQHQINQYLLLDH